MSLELKIFRFLGAADLTGSLLSAPAAANECGLPPCDRNPRDAQAVTLLLEDCFEACETPLRLTALRAPTRGCRVAPKVTVPEMMSLRGPVRGTSDELDRMISARRCLLDFTIWDTFFVSLAKDAECLQQTDRLKTFSPYWAQVVDSTRSDRRGVSEPRQSVYVANKAIARGTLD